MTKQVHVRQSEGVANLTNLRHKPVDSPQCRILRSFRPPTSQLVVKHDLPVRSERLKRFQVVVSGARTAV